MKQFGMILCMTVLGIADGPMSGSAQKVPDIATLIIVEQRPRPDAVALIRVGVNEHGQMVNTITVARDDVSRASIYAAVSLLNAFRDANETIRDAAVFALKPDNVPNEHELSVEARKYVEYYLHRLTKDDGPPHVEIPLRPRRAPHDR